LLLLVSFRGKKAKRELFFSFPNGLVFNYQFRLGYSSYYI
jgi:hypothetical protein